MLVRRAVVALALVTATAAAGCSALLSADPTPVPGAAATLTRSIRTPIPTPLRTAAASPSPSPARVGVASPGPSPAATDQTVSEAEIATLQRRMEQTVGSAALPGVEALLLDHVSLSTAQGGEVMDTSQAATWLRDHAGSNITVARLDRSTQSLVLQVLTNGWPAKDPIQQGQVTFSLRRYDANGRPDEDRGEWKIDVIEAL
ncbi:MAG: hypothetical protein LC797_02730 [Chloroflexi bacterium]|nr:hypothetical protein [Chloroflexota bacterium]